MKMFLSLVIFAISFQAFGQSANNSLSSTGQVKSRKAEYLAVVNGAASPITRGMAVCLDLADDNGVSVDLCSAAGAKPIGVVTDVSCAVGARCLLLTKGFFAFGKFDYLATQATAGGMIYADVDGDLIVPATVTTAMFPVGSVLDTVAVDSSALKIYIDL